MRAHHRIGLILLALVLVPTLGYVAYEANALSENEALLESIYAQQLDALLFSVNQRAFDVSEGWARDLTADLQRTVLAGRPLAAALDSTLARDDALVGAFLADTTLQQTVVVAGDSADAVLPLDDAFVRRLLGRYRVGYQQLAPQTLWTDLGTARLDRIALSFVTDAAVPGYGDPPYVAGLVLDVPTFINDVLGPKMASVSQGAFVLSVADTAGAVLYRTEAVTNTEGRPSVTPSAARAAESADDDRETPAAEIVRKRLWILPAHTVSIGVAGEGIGDTLRRRFRRNLLVIGLLGVFLLGAAVFAYRSVQQEIELARVRARLVSNVSHELRTPLALIRMYAETLEAGRVPDKRRPEYLGVIARESERLSRLIDTLLNFSRIEAGRERFDLAPTDLNALARDVTARFALPAERDGFTIETAFADDLPTVEADAEALTEALVNLVDNALKYSRPHPGARRVAIRTGVHRNGSRPHLGRGPQAFVEVEDDGPGIAAAHQRQVFEPFFRVGDDARDDLVHETKGTGLGLALVARIAEAHGGRIDLHSAPGDGARFRLLLPVDAAT